MTHAIWNKTSDKWLVNCGTQGVVNIVSTFQVPTSNSLGVIVSCDKWHVICDMLHKTHDTWHVTPETQAVVNIV